MLLYFAFVSQPALPWPGKKARTVKMRSRWSRAMNKFLNRKNIFLLFICHRQFNYFTKFTSLWVFLSGINMKSNPKKNCFNNNRNHLKVTAQVFGNFLENVSPFFIHWTLNLENSKICNSFPGNITIYARKSASAKGNKDMASYLVGSYGAWRICGLRKL